MAVVDVPVLVGNEEPSQQGSVAPYHHRVVVDRGVGQVHRRHRDVTNRVAGQFLHTGDEIQSLGARRLAAQMDDGREQDSQTEG